MCTGAEVALIAGATATTAMTLSQKKPDMPQAPEPVKPPEQAKTPERDPFMQKNKNSALTGGPASTMLTGAGGVAPSGLSLGRTSLYDNEKSKLGA